MCLVVFIMYLYFSKSSVIECKHRHTGLQIIESILKINFLNQGICFGFQKNRLHEMAL